MSPNVCKYNPALGVPRGVPCVPVKVYKCWLENVNVHAGKCPPWQMSKFAMSFLANVQVGK